MRIQSTDARRVSRPRLRGRIHPVAAAHRSRGLHGIVVVAILMLMVLTLAPTGAEAAGLAIRSVAAQDVGRTHADIRWSLTKPATGRVVFGTTRKYGRITALESSFGYATHVQRLSGLRPGTLYHYRVRSRDRGGHLVVSRDRTFRTDPAVRKPTAGIRVPAWIDATGSTDAGGALQRFVDGVPNGSAIVFRAGAIYRVSHGIRLQGRRNLVFKGHGATIRTTGSGDQITASPFLIEGGSSGIRLRNLVLVGNNPRAGTAAAFGGGENQMGVAIYGSTDIELANLRMRGFFSDCVYISAGAGRVPARRIRIHDSTCRLNGRSGVTIVSASGVTIARNRFDAIGMFVVNIEPDSDWETVTNVVIRNNRIGSYGLTDRYTSWVLAAEGATGSTVRNVSLIENRVTGGRAGYDGKPLGLNVTVRDRGPRQNFVVRGNTATITVAGPVIQMLGVDGVIVTGNKQPLRTGKLATFPGSTNVTYRP